MTVDATCKGCYALGTACGKCQRCAYERRGLASAMGDGSMASVPTHEEALAWWREKKRTFTPRGFEDFARFKDTHGNTVTVRESSADGGPFVWVFCHHEDAGVHTDNAPHLDKLQALKLAQALTDFAYRKDTK